LEGVAAKKSKVKKQRQFEPPSAPNSPRKAKNKTDFLIIFMNSSFVVLGVLGDLGGEKIWFS